MHDDQTPGLGPAPPPAEPAAPPVEAAEPPDGHTALHSPVGHHHYRRLEHLAHALGADDDLPIDPDLAPDDTGEPSRQHRSRPGGPPRTHRADPVVLAAIFVGGFLGTLGRYVVEDAWPSPAEHFPTATFVINTSGAFLLGLLLTVLLERLRSRHRLIRPFAVTGVLGGWTTYSTMVAGAVTIGHAGHLTLAAGYLALTLVCGITGVALGMALGRSRTLDGLAAVAPAVWRRAPSADAAHGDPIHGDLIDPDADGGPGGDPDAPGLTEARR